jgi:Protein of unknown function (DUF3465)
MKKLVLIGVALVAAYFGAVESGLIPGKHDTGTIATTGADEGLAAAFEHRQSNVQVQGGGRVSRVLPDDNEGSRHQRFILQLASGQTLLVAHNIDLANRIVSLQPGDDVEFNGEYAWNERGGVIHWTHRDPQRSHVDGWIKHKGRTYQ